MSCQANDVPIMMLATFEFCKPSRFTTLKYCSVSTTNENSKTAIAVMFGGRLKNDLIKQYINMTTKTSPIYGRIKLS